MTACHICGIPAPWGCAICAAPDQASSPALQITPNQLGLLHHTLGLRPDRREPFRNHFVAGEGHHDQADLLKLEALGLMRRARTPSFCDDDDIVFMCTEAGKTYAIDHLPMPPKRSKYDDYLSSESSMLFGEWLVGWALPQMEVDYFTHRTDRYRMKSTNATGEWKPTKKEAKASYKAAMLANRAAQKGCAA